MTNIQKQTEQAEAVLDERRRLFLRGVELIKEWGKNAHECEFKWDAVSSELGTDGMRAYATAVEILSEENAAHPPPKVVSGGVTPDEKPSRAVEKIIDTAANPKLNDILAVSALSQFMRAMELRQVELATAKKYGVQISLFFKIIGEGERSPLMISSITVPKLILYADILPSLPPRVRLKDVRPIADLVASAERPIDPVTRRSHANAVNMFLQFCEDRHYPLPRDFQSILKPLLRKPKQDVEKRDERPFTVREVQEFFASPLFAASALRRPSDFWCPLIALYTGAREGELCQLLADDVKRDDKGVWLLDIRSQSKSGKKLKNDHSRRLVPLHTDLIEIGFVDFASGTPKGSRLFPLEKRNALGQFSAFSKRFTYLRRKIGIRGRTFHSFRHIVNDTLIDMGCEGYIVEALVGHSLAKFGEGFRSYSSGPSVEAKMKIVELLDFGLDIPMLTELARRVDAVSLKSETE